MPLNPPQTWGCQAKNDPPETTILYALRIWRVPITAARCLTCPPGLIDPYEPFHPEVTATWVTLEAKSMPLISPQT